MPDRIVVVREPAQRVQVRTPGVPGPRGAQGDKGDKGDQGDVGPVGPPIDTSNILIPASAEPPDAASLQLWTQELAGRDLLTIKAPNGRVYQLQPAFFGNFVGMIQPSRTTALTNLGMPHSSVGVISHPVNVAADYQVYGRMANVITPVAVGGIAAIYSTDALFFRGTQGAPKMGGWFSACRVGTPNVGDVKMLVGLTSLGGVAHDLASGAHWAAFHYDPNVSPNWLFVTKFSGAYTAADTGVAVLAGEVYDFYSRCRPAGTEIDWQVDRLNDPTSAAGVTDTNLPNTTALMRIMVQIQSIEAAGAARSIRFQRIYIETDR